MTISAQVHGELFDTADGGIIRLPPMPLSPRAPRSACVWTVHEHNRFLEALEKYPRCPWRVIADFVGTKTTRQTMTHAQKYRQKIERWKRGAKLRIGHVKISQVLNPYSKEQREREQARERPCLPISNAGMHVQTNTNTDEQDSLLSDEEVQAMVELLPDPSGGLQDCISFFFPLSWSDVDFSDTILVPEAMSILHEDKITASTVV